MDDLVPTLSVFVSFSIDDIFNILLKNQIHLPPVSFTISFLTVQHCIHTYEQATQLFSPFDFSLSNTGIHIEEQVTQFFKKWICVQVVLFCMTLFTNVKDSMHMAVLFLMDNGLKKNHWCSRLPSWGVAGRNLRDEGQRSLVRAVATQCTGEGFYFTSDRKKPNVYWGPNPDSVCEADILPLDHLLLMDNG